MSGTLKLLFYSQKNRNVTYPPNIYIALGDHGVKESMPLLTPQMVPSEIDYNIDNLISELEKLRKEAKKKVKNISYVLNNTP